MQPRAFVVMPFNRKRSARRSTEIDFNRVFHDLFEPALRQAGYDVVRADSERSAGSASRIRMRRGMTKCICGTTLPRVLSLVVHILRGSFR